MQVRCEHCGRDFKSPQGLAGHYAARHEAQDQEEALQQNFWLRKDMMLLYMKTTLASAYQYNAQDL